jgi:RNA polymerase sigma factor (sigma-70 family)
MIISIARQCGLTHDDAEDIAQDTLMITYRRITSLSDPMALGGWIRTTATRQSWRASTAQRRHRDRCSRLAEVDTPIEIDDRLIAHETMRLVVAAMQHLSPRERLILEMTVTADQPAPYATVAAAVGCAVGSVGALRGRAVQHLAHVMQRLDEQTPETSRHGQTLRVA